MGDLLRGLVESATTYPTVIVTVLLGLVIVYWVVSSLTGAGGEVDGALEGGLESLVDGAAESAFEGALEGLESLADGAGEAALEGMTEGVAEGMAEGLGEAGAEAGAEGAADSLAWSGLGRLFGCLGLTAVPVTLFLSMLILFTWLMSLGLSRLLGHHVGMATTGLITGGGLLMLAGALGLGLTALVVRPLRPLFKSPDTLKRRDLVGQQVTIRSLRVDERFGQAEYADGQAGLLLHVRCHEPGLLSRGQTAIITRYDPADEVFYVAPTPGAPAPGEPAPENTTPKTDVS